jgi:hypothetical protein
VGTLHLYQGLPNHPVKDGTIPLSPIQILQAWVASDPITWPANDPYFTRTSTLDGVVWHINSKTLELVLSSIEVLCQSLNEVYDLLINIPISRYDPDSDNKMIDHLRNRHTFPAVRFADVMYKQRVEKSLDHVKVLKTLFAEGEAVPLTPSLPPMSREGSPAMIQCWEREYVEGYSSIPTTREECINIKKDLTSQQVLPRMDHYPYLDPSVTERVNQHDKEHHAELAQEGMPPSGSFCLPGISPWTISIPTASHLSHPAPNPPPGYSTPVNVPL